MRIVLSFRPEYLNDWEKWLVAVETKDEESGCRLLDFWGKDRAIRINGDRS